MDHNPTEWVVADPDTTPRNETDYCFPDDWGLRTPEQKDEWFSAERAYRQAMRQDTTMGERLRDQHSPSEFRVDT
ncbi:hypothetical protein EXE44_05050 [Halorubrum sp. SS7]|nr:hypothetical protein EXE42_16860 [Halorubrum sp. SP3]TKX58915.1 hypothetical protein EXE44_05050 [Halorubrum sp. SS7]